MTALPNILTGGRLVLTLVVLGALAWAPYAPAGLKPDLQLWALVAFVVAAVTDFFDGWLARLMKAESLLGAILDPIADKVLVAAAIVGLLAAGRAEAALPGGLILFREFAVSALRETLAPKGLRLPVTLLAKWKTTLQLIALAVMLAAPLLPAWPIIGAAGLGLLWLAALITVWTGAEYGLSAARALSGRA